MGWSQSILQWGLNEDMVDLFEVYDAGLVTDGFNERAQTQVACAAQETLAGRRLPTPDSEWPIWLLQGDCAECGQYVRRVRTRPWAAISI